MTCSRPATSRRRCNDLYGGTYRIFTKVYERGLRVTFLSADGLAEPREDARDRRRSSSGSRRRRTRSSAHRHPRRGRRRARGGALVVVDNTFATPYLQQPLELGADVVVHSHDEVLGGHSDVVGGALATTTTVSERARVPPERVGAVPGPFDSWLVLRGTKTLAVRMERHCENAIDGRRVPRAARRGRAKVTTPGSPRHPSTRSPSGRCGLRRHGLVRARGASRRRVKRRARHEDLTLAESLGGVETLIEHPARMTHARPADAPRAVPPTASSACRSASRRPDLIADLEQALAG